MNGIKITKYGTSFFTMLNYSPRCKCACVFVRFRVFVPCNLLRHLLAIDGSKLLKDNIYLDSEDKVFQLFVGILMATSHALY